MERESGWRSNGSNNTSKYATHTNDGRLALLARDPKQATIHKVVKKGAVGCVTNTYAQPNSELASRARKMHRTAS